jgi:uncharacterized protein YkwD
MLCKFVAAAVVAAFLADQGKTASETKSPETQPKPAAAAPRNAGANVEKSAEATGSKSEVKNEKADAKADEKQAEKKPVDSSLKGLHDIEKKVIEKTNAERARYGLPPLVVDRNLVQSARTHAAWMTNSRTLQHTSAPVAENIAMGQRSSGEALSSWMGSSGHRANILNSGHRRIGVAAYRTPDGTIYWCQQFLP